MRRVLLLGESWFIHSIHQKGFDSFTTSEYEEGGAEFSDALRQHGWTVTHIPAHRIHTDLPTNVEELMQYSCIVISDVGANTFLLSPRVFHTSRTEPNKLVMIRDYVLAGGALLMVGGYMSFAGVDAKAAYARSPIAPILPVKVLESDDRVERPEGVRPRVVLPHAALAAECGTTWPVVLGYNRTLAHPEGIVIVEVEDDPLLAVREIGAGRTAAFTSDLAPHWAPPPFLAWDAYGPMWHTLLSWLRNSRRSDSATTAPTLREGSDQAETSD